MSLVAALSPLLLAAAAPSNEPCKPIPGWDEVLTRDDLRFIVIGEIHGNNETPALFAEAVCLTAQSWPVVVALEQPSIDQPAIDSFMASDGSPEAKVAFLKAVMWNGSMKDGRSSEATFRLFEDLRRMHATGQVKAVVAFLPSHLTEYPGPAGYEQAMAEGILVGDQPGTITLVLTGNAHAMRTQVPWEPKYMAMAGHLPAEATVTLNTFAEGGETWVCQSGVCGAKPWPAAPESRPRSVSLSSDEQGLYSGVIHLGTSLTASPPQVPAPQTDQEAPEAD